MQYSLRNLHLAQKIVSRFSHTTGRALNLSVWLSARSFRVSIHSCGWDFPPYRIKPTQLQVQAHFEERNVAFGKAALYQCSNPVTRRGPLHLRFIFFKMIISEGRYWDLVFIMNNFFFLWGCSPTPVMASSFLMRFLDHTQRRTTVSRTPLDE
jgi:hypothetical protein